WDTIVDYKKLLDEIHSNTPMMRAGRKVWKPLPEPVKWGLRKIGQALSNVLGGWDTLMKFQRERILFNNFKALSFPMTQAVGNSVILGSGGQFESLLRMWRKDAWWNTRKQIVRG